MTTTTGTGKVAIVTGASAGIGRATSVALNQAGWNVVVTARRADELEKTKELMKVDDSRQCLAVAGDITDESFVKTLFTKTKEQFGRLDLLFNNAGLGQRQVPIEEIPVEVFQKVVTINLVAPFICTKEAMQLFKSQSPPGGRIINNGSISAIVPRPLSYAYAASKHGLTGLTKTTALEGRKYNVACTQINIGNAATAMGSQHTGGTLQPDGRMVEEPSLDVKHVVDAILHIAGLPNEVSVLEMTVL
ncbi:hypothetical protein AAF712_006828 [Marasmius tenuissimus]|uniref:Short-chain dehydrogenase/reductase SDR n=1 Tax=Marasmius tenuissimus TaxID=585030 RepID=A0ABR2ZXU3_9AGAR